MFAPHMAARIFITTLKYFLYLKYLTLPPPPFVCRSIIVLLFRYKIVIFSTQLRQIFCCVFCWVFRLFFCSGIVLRAFSSFSDLPTPLWCRYYLCNSSNAVVGFVDCCQYHIFTCKAMSSSCCELLLQASPALIFAFCFVWILKRAFIREFVVALFIISRLCSARVFGNKFQSIGQVSWVHSEIMKNSIVYKVV